MTYSWLWLVPAGIIMLYAAFAVLYFGALVVCAIIGAYLKAREVPPCPEAPYIEPPRVAQLRMAYNVRRRTKLDLAIDDMTKPFPRPRRG